MKVALLVAFAIVSVMAADDGAANCKCWEDFVPEKGEDDWYCRGKKNNRIFGCNEDKPPLCTCKEKGVPVVLDFGETSCTSPGSNYDSLHCEPTQEWETYLSGHPEKRIYF